MMNAPTLLVATRRLLFARLRRVTGMVVPALGILVAVTSVARAQTINWVGTMSTDWNTAANWDADMVPGSSNDVILDTNSGNQAVFSSGNETIGNLVVGNLNGGANTALSITNGANLTATSLTIGAQSGSNGTVSISGANSTLVVSNLTVGNFTQAASGLRGSGPAKAIVGTGNLFIGNGANVTNSGNFNIGPNGTITQTGGVLDLIQSNNQFLQGSLGEPPPNGVYSLLGGVLQATEGLFGTVTLNFGGGTIQIGASDEYGVSTVLMDDTTSILNLNSPAPSSFGFKDGGSRWIGSISGNGNLEVTGIGALELNSGSYAYTGTTIINGATLAINNPLTASNVTVNNGGTLTGSGNILGSVTVNSGSYLTPGFNYYTSFIIGPIGEGGVIISLPQSLSVGALSLATGTTTNFYLSAPGNYTQLMVTNALIISGNLVLNLDNPLYAGTYNLITAGSQSGDFASVLVAGNYSGTLTETNGKWSGTVSGVNFSYTTATGVATISVNRLVGVSVGRTAWLEGNFTIAQLLDPTVSGDSASPAEDGVPNLMKYAFDLGPFDNIYPVWPQPVVSDGNLVLTFTEYQSDITYTVEASTDLVNWNTEGVTVQMNGIQATATYPLPESGSAFMRVVVAPGP
jgi:T5SS/PEP-CTERM-associated repeat protein